MKRTRFSRDFILVVTGQIVSIFGNQILRYAIPLYVLNQTGSSALFGTISAVAFIPMLLLYPVGGILADRLNKKKVMVVLDLSTSILVFIFCLLAGSVEIVPLIATMMIALYAIQGAYQPAVHASIPVLVPPEYLIQGNSIVNTVTSLSGMAGPVMGGVLFSWVGLDPILYVSIGCFLASAIMEMFIHIPFVKQQREKNMIRTGLSDLKDGFRFMFREKPVLWKISVFFSGVGLLLTSLVLIALPVLITQRLGFAPDTANRLYGYALGVMAGGAITGGAIAGVVASKLKPQTIPFILTGCAFSVLAGGMALQMLTAPLTIYVVLTLGAGSLTALSTLFQIQVMSYIQILTPKELVGKVISFVICICMCLLPAGQLMYGFVFETIGHYVYVPFYVAGVTMAIVTLLTRQTFARIRTLSGT